MLSTHIKHYDNGNCEGVVMCTNDNAGCLWVEYTNIVRQSQFDALEDARLLKNTIESVNHEVTA